MDYKEKKIENYKRIKKATIRLPSRMVRRSGLEPPTPTMSR